MIYISKGAWLTQTRVARPPKVMSTISLTSLPKAFKPFRPPGWRRCWTNGRLQSVLFILWYSKISNENSMALTPCLRRISKKRFLSKSSHGSTNVFFLYLRPFQKRFAYGCKNSLTSSLLCCFYEDFFSWKQPRTEIGNSNLEKIAKTYVQSYCVSLR